MSRIVRLNTVLQLCETFVTREKHLKDFWNTSATQANYIKHSVASKGPTVKNALSSRFLNSSGKILE